MKEVAIKYLNNQLNSGVTHIGLATKASMRIFFIEDVIEALKKYDDEVMLRDHDGIRLKELGEAPRKRELQELYRKALYHIKLSKYDRVSCETETAKFFKGEVTGGNTNCPWDVVVKNVIKIQIKGIGGAMSDEARTAEPYID